MIAWYWTISPYSLDAHGVFSVSSGGNLNYSYALHRGSVRPSLYLKSNVKIVSGLGTKDNMYKLEI